MNPVKITSKIELPTFRKYWLSRFFKKPTTMLFYFSMIVLSVLAKFDILPPFIALFGLFASIALPVFILFKVKSVYNQNLFFKREVEYTFNEDSVEILQEGNAHSSSYKDLYKIAVDGEFVLIYFSQLVAFYIDGESFRSHKDSESLVAYLEGLSELNFEKEK